MNPYLEFDLSKYKFPIVFYLGKVLFRNAILSIYL